MNCSSVFFHTTSGTSICIKIFGYKPLKLTLAKRKSTRLNRAEESSLESAETKYIQDILRQEELKSLIHVPLMEYISKIICIFFCPYGTLLRIQNLSRERAHVFLPWLSWNGEKRNLFLKSFISDFAGED